MNNFNFSNLTYLSWVSKPSCLLFPTENTKRFQICYYLSNSRTWLVAFLRFKNGIDHVFRIKKCFIWGRADGPGVRRCEPFSILFNFCNWKSFDGTWIWYIPILNILFYFVLQFWTFRMIDTLHVLHGYFYNV